MNWIPLGIVCIYIILLYLITWLTRRLSAGGMVAYLLAGRSLPYWVIAPLLTGLAIGGASTIGVAERAYNVGISAGWYNAAWAAGALLVGLFAAHKYRQLEVSTLPELFERHYSVSGRVIGVIGQLVLQLVITSLQYVAGGAILSSLLPEVFSFQTEMLVTAVVFVGITLIGGFWAAGLTNIINVTFIYAGVLLAAFMAVGKVGGFGEIIARLPAEHSGFDIGAIGWGLIIAWFVVMCTTVFSVQSIVQISFAGKDARASQKGFILGALMILPDVSTASALLIGSATLVVGDLIKRFIAPDLSEAREKLISRISVLVLSLFTYLLAVSVSGILKTLLVGLTLTTAYTLITLMTIFWPQVCRRSHASWTLLMAMAALILWLIVPQIPTLFKGMGMPHPIYFCWVVSLVTFFVVSVVDKRKILGSA
jgi:SSS family solute:Na+ symporter